MTTMKSYRLSGITLGRMNLIKERMKEMYGEEPTETEIIKLAIQELFKETNKEYRVFKEGE